MRRKFRRALNSSYYRSCLPWLLLPADRGCSQPTGLRQQRLFHDCRRVASARLCRLATGCIAPRQVARGVESPPKSRLRHPPSLLSKCVPPNGSLRDPQQHQWPQHVQQRQSRSSVLRQQSGVVRTAAQRFNGSSPGPVRLAASTHSAHSPHACQRLPRARPARRQQTADQIWAPGRRVTPARCRWPAPPPCARGPYRAPFRPRGPQALQPARSDPGSRHRCVFGPNGLAR